MPRLKKTHPRQLVIDELTNILGNVAQRDSWKFINRIGTPCRIHLLQFVFRYERKVLDRWIKISGMKFSEEGAVEEIRRILDGHKPYKRA